MNEDCYWCGGECQSGGTTPVSPEMQAWVEDPANWIDPE